MILCSFALNLIGLMLFLVIGVYPVRPPVPAVGGYEGVGEVHSVGSGVKGLEPGDWVIPSPPSFGSCPFAYFDYCSDVFWFLEVFFLLAQLSC